MAVKDVESSAAEVLFFLWCLIKLLVTGINESWEWGETGKPSVPIKLGSPGAASDSSCFSNCQKWGRVFWRKIPLCFPGFF